MRRGFSTGRNSGRDTRNSFAFTSEMDLCSPVAKELCRKLGIADSELQAKTIADFQSPLVPIETAERLFQHHSERRKIALRLLECELQRLQHNGDSPSRKSLEGAKSLTPSRRLEYDFDVQIDQAQILAQKIATRKREIQLTLKVAENRELIQLKTIQQIENSLRERSERMAKRWEELKEKEDQLRVKFQKKRQREQEILEKRKQVLVTQEEDSRESHEALIAPTPIPSVKSILRQRERSSISAPPKRATQKEEDDLQRKLDQFERKM